LGADFAADLAVGLGLDDLALGAGLALPFVTGFFDEPREAEAPLETFEGPLALDDVFRAAFDFATSSGSSRRK
jgi:hypothetical protein